MKISYFLVPGLGRFLIENFALIYARFETLLKKPRILEGA
jgi:hypothetical protein